jgi:hypothetical protein
MRRRKAWKARCMKHAIECFAQSRLGALHATRHRVGEETFDMARASAGEAETKLPQGHESGTMA